MKQTMRRVIDTYFEELFNRGRVELVSELLAEDYVNHSPGSPEMDTGRAGVAWLVPEMRRAFPNLHFAVEDCVVGDSAVAVRTRMTGTHRGDFFGLKATGRSFSVIQMNFEHFDGERIGEHWRLTDDVALMRQLGVSHEHK